MSTPAAVDITYRIGVEAARGTLPVAGANKRLPSLSITPSARIEVENFTGAGYKNTTTSSPHKLYGQGNYAGKLDFNSIIYVLESLIGSSGPTGAGVAKTRLYNPNTTGPDSNAKTYVVERVKGSTCQRALYTKLTSLSLRSTQESLDVSGNCASRFPTEGETPSAGGINEVQRLTPSGTIGGGTFDFTFGGDTATIPFDATAGEVQELLIDLPAFNAGDVVVSGGPISEAALLVEYAGQYAATNVSLAAVDATNLTGTDPDVTPETVTAGASSGITDIPSRPVTRGMIDVFVADSYADLAGESGTFQKITHVYEEAMDVGDKDSMFWAHNTDYASFVDLIEIAHSLSFMFKTAHNAQSEEQYNSIANNPTKYFLWRATGVELETGVNELIELRCAAKFAATELDIGGAPYGYGYTMNLLHDADFGRAYSWKVINSIASL